MDKIHELVSDIRSLKIQGASDIALAVLTGIKLSAESDFALIRETAIRLAYARPTEPLAQNAVRFLSDYFANKDLLMRKIAQYEKLIIEAKSEIVSHCTDLIEDGGVYLTHCHSSTAVAVFKKARENKRNFSVYVTETRPLFQGRVTAEELLASGVARVTFLIDDAIFSLISKLGKGLNAIFIGADLLTEEGFVNKVGSLGLVSEASRKQIPVFIYSTLLKYDPRSFNEKLIEHRSGREIWKDAPEGLSFYTPAFDFVPYSDNVSLVTEIGLIKGTDVHAKALNKYPFIKN